MTHNMKLLFSAAAAAALMMSAPAFAQDAGLVKIHEGRSTGTTQWKPYHDPNAVFVGGTCAGSDARSRQTRDLLRDLPIVQGVAY
jgi:hypothetical protein